MNKLHFNYKQEKHFCQEWRKINMEKKYYLGLDIGTNSVGWAVTDENYDLCKFNGKKMWGIRLFEDAKTAAERRAKRSNRRRMARTKQRIDLLQELCEKGIFEKDPTFFIRLNESSLHLEDKSTSEKYPLFVDKEYTDVDYHREYPTVYHLRKELIESPEPHDPRLVYLACCHIIKSRGHFLVNGSISDAKDLSFICENMINSFNAASDYKISIQDMTALETILADRKMAKSVKAKQIVPLFECIPCEDKEQQKCCKAIITNLSKLIVGLKGDISKIFNESFEEIKSFKFAETKYEDEILPTMEEIYPDHAEIIEKIKSIYDWSILDEILDGEEYLSFAKVKAYEKHKKNLHDLKILIKKYCDDETYQSFFNGMNEKNKYSNYIGSIRKNGHTYKVEKCKSPEDFYKELLKLLSSINPDQEDESLLEQIKFETENQTLLPLLRTKENGTIPNQVHMQELIKILDNASKYLDFLNEKDEYGTIAEKIISITKFRIPYYVGPLSRRHKEEGSNSWMVRKEEGRIYPWNFGDKVDVEKSNKEFIQRMTNKCTYLIGEDVLPKNSLLYSKYMVLNELNNLKIRGKKISVKLKQQIYNDLFCTKARVTGKNILDYLKKEDPELAAEDLSGFDIDFKSSLTSYLDFKKQVIGDNIEKDHYKEMIEEIIKWKTIYNEDSKMMKRMITREFPETLNQDQIKKICHLKYNGWGNFSETFLNGIKGANKETGESYTIIEALWKTNYNLMQRLSKQFSFKEEIDQINAEKTGTIGKITYENLVKDLVVSPANKRAIWQTIQITEEIKKVMKCEPERIFIEMARGGEKEKKRTVSRKTRLQELYTGCKDDTRNWMKEIGDREEREFSSRKLYLYYTQMGKCMYTGEEIDVDLLMTANSKWDIDHIYPQCKIKDDSFDNMVLVRKDVNNHVKRNHIVPSSIRKEMTPYWKMLLQKGLISKKKYERLTRSTDFTDEELSGFIERQLVETRQSSKAVAELLTRLYKNSEVVYVKAGLVSDFRHDNELLKSRRINDYHHAKDAFLNIVVGNCYRTKFTANPRKWIKKNRDTNYSIRRVFDFDIKQGDKVVWYGNKNENGKHTIDQIKKTMSRNDILYTEYTYCEKGKLFDETLTKKGNKKAVPLKKNLDPLKYGGYTSIKTSAFAFIEFDDKKKERKNHIVEIPIYVANIAKREPEAVIKYLEEQKGYVNVVVKKYPIKKNSLLKIDGYLARLRGGDSSIITLKNAVQLVLDKKSYEIIRKVEKYLDHNSKYEANSKLEKFNENDLNIIYNELCLKLRNSIYQKRPVHQLETLEQGIDNFKSLESLKDKAKIINELLVMFRCDAKTGMDLRLIGGSSNSGRMRISKSRLTSKSLKLINQSVTGLFETEEELV